MARYAMVTDLRKCVGCHACTVACNGEWNVPAGHARTHVHTTPLEGTFPNLAASPYVAQCNHCDDAPCLAACPSGATFRSPDGIVHIDRKVCIGCGYCVEACPYDARYIDEAVKKADKCDFCAARLERGEQPACVATCTAHAKYFGDLEDRRGEVFHLVYSNDAQRVESARVAVGPNVYYLGKRERMELVKAAFAPREPRLPASGGAWRVVRPLIMVAVGATFLGQAAAFFNQLWNGEQDDDE